MEDAGTFFLSFYFWKENSTLCVSKDNSNVNPKSDPAVESSNSYSSIEDLMYNSRWKNKLVGRIRGRRDRTKMKRGGDGGNRGRQKKKIRNREDKQRDGVSGLKCAPCGVCDGLLLHGAQLMQQADTESNPKTNAANVASIQLILSLSTHWVFHRTHSDRLEHYYCR